MDKENVIYIHTVDLLFINNKEIEGTQITNRSNNMDEPDSF